jgi:hypothetical protein
MAWVDPTINNRYIENGEVYTASGAKIRNSAADYGAYASEYTTEAARKQANLAWNTGDGGRLGYYLQTGVDLGTRPNGISGISAGDYTGDGTYGAYSGAHQAAADAIRASISQGTKALESQKSTVDQTYDELARQAYAQYRQQQTRLPSQTSNLATGTADSLALQGTLNYENNLALGERERADTLSSIDSDIAQLRASGDASLAQNAEKYALMAEQYRQQQEQQEQQAYERQLAIYWKMLGYTDGQIADMLNQYQVNPGSAYLGYTLPK